MLSPRYASETHTSPNLNFLRAITQAFDPTSESYGEARKFILNPDLQTIPRVPQVLLIGNGTVYNHEGLAKAKLKHPHHKTFHANPVSDEDESNGVTRFFRWCNHHLTDLLENNYSRAPRHIDDTMYGLSP
jgi:hypothetical protein